MAEYIVIQWRHENPHDPIELFYEVQGDRAVTRMVERFADNALVADSLAIAAQREPNLVNNACLCDGSFPDKAAYKAEFCSDATSYKIIDKPQFDDLFSRATEKS